MQFSNICIIVQQNAHESWILDMSFAKWQPFCLGFSVLISSLHRPSLRKFIPDWGFYDFRLSNKASITSIQLIIWMIVIKIIWNQSSNFHVLLQWCKFSRILCDDDIYHTYLFNNVKFGNKMELYTLHFYEQISPVIIELQCVRERTVPCPFAALSAKYSVWGPIP